MNGNNFIQLQFENKITDSYTCDTKMFKRLHKMYRETRKGELKTFNKDIRESK